MKNLTTILILLIYAFTYSQTSEVRLHDFLLENKSLIWQHIYESNLSANELMQNFLEKDLSLMKSKKVNKSENSLVFTVENDEIDFTKFGGKWSTTPDFVKFPHSYKVIVEVKDKKYRVTLKNMNVAIGNNMGIADFSPDWINSKLIDAVTRKRNTEFRKTNDVVKGLEILQNYYQLKFELKENEKQNNEW